MHPCLRNQMQKHIVRQKGSSADEYISEELHKPVIGGFYEQCFEIALEKQRKKLFYKIY